VSDNPTVREWLEGQLTALLPDGWKIIPNQKTPQTIDVTTVVVKLTTIEPLAEAPAGSLSNGAVITIADPHKDDVAAENALDDSVLALCTALDALAGITWSKAQKVLVNDTYLGWDITCSILSTKAS
jgi:hypothetical protein